MPARLPTPKLDDAIRHWVLRAFPRATDGPVDYDAPSGDPGLFGPDSATWRIHADFPGMLAGGLCALMLQTLHPRALAGVWDHSRFRTDLLGRLRRTTAFIAATSFAPRAAARTLIARVGDIHRLIRGHDAHGRPYAADEPALLTWVHVTEAYGFLEGFRQLAPVPLSPAAEDRYYDEVRRIAEALGATAVPARRAEVVTYFEQIRGELEYSPRSRDVLGVLERVQLPVPAAWLSRQVFLGAGASLLPDWAADMLQRGPARRLADRAAAAPLRRLGPMFRSALDGGVAARSCRRVGRDPATLLHF